MTHDEMGLYPEAEAEGGGGPLNASPEASRANRTEVVWIPVAAEGLRVSRRLTTPISKVERTLRIESQRAIELAYGRPPGPEGLIVSLRLVPSLDWLRVPVHVESWTPAPEHRKAVISIRWQATRLARSFPVMDADLILKPAEHGGCELVLEGRYRPPLGVVGLLGDRLIGRFIATATARNFVDRLVEWIEQEGREGQPS